MASDNDGNINKKQMDEEAVNNFRQYLRIPTVHPNINYDECIKFLENQAKSIGLPYKIYYCAPDKPIFVMTWTGKQPDLPTIWLSSHMDVVPVYEEKWTHKPFAADMDEEGNIYARGAQDTKALGIQYLEAIKRLRKDGVSPKRTIHLAFTPEEEVSGIKGMRDFAPTEDFRKLNVGFALDEGKPSLNNNFVVVYGERFIWQIRVYCPGEQGHGSLLMQHPPGNKIGIILNKFNEYRAKELKKLEENPELTLGDVTTINLTKLEGGVQANVVPPEFIATFDIRIPSTVDIEEFETLLNTWCKEAGKGVSIEYINRDLKVPNTKLDDSNPFWIAFKSATDSLNMKLIPEIMPGGTDTRFIRTLGIPALGFAPMTNTPILAHDNNEYLNVKVFLKGIDIFTKIIPALGNVN